MRVSVVFLAVVVATSHAITCAPLEHVASRLNIRQHNGTAADLLRRPPTSPNRRATTEVSHLDHRTTTYCEVGQPACTFQCAPCYLNNLRRNEDNRRSFLCPTSNSNSNVFRPPPTPTNLRAKTAATHQDLRTTTICELGQPAYRFLRSP